MAYTDLGAFLARVAADAIRKLDGADAAGRMRIAEDVEAWARRGSITEAQLASLLAALPAREPDAPAAGAEAPGGGTAAEAPGPAAVLASLGSRPTKARLLAALAQLGVDAPEGATNPELYALAEAAAGEAV